MRVNKATKLALCLLTLLGAIQAANAESLPKGYYATELVYLLTMHNAQYTSQQYRVHLDNKLCQFEQHSENNSYHFYLDQVSMEIIDNTGGVDADLVLKCKYGDDCIIKEGDSPAYEQFLKVTVYNAYEARDNKTAMQGIVDNMNHLTTLCSH